MNYPQWSSATTSFTTTQWSHAESKELVAARAELDTAFMDSKRNRLLWDQISSRLLSLGFNRSANQCKYRWKNLVTRYKAIEALDSETARTQFPFLQELRAIFDARLQRLMSETIAAEKGVPGRSTFFDDEEDPMLGQALHVAQEEAAGKRRKDGGGASSASRRRVVELFQEFVRQQERMDVEWRREQEVRESARVAREREWMQTMVAMERERLEAERRWRDAEEQRRSREEDRAVRRDALVTALINRLLHGDGGGGDQYP